MNDERDMVEAAKRLLDQATDDLDGATVHRLQRARNHALATRPTRTSWLRRPWPLAGTIGTALTAAALTVFVALQPSEQETVEQHLVADLGIITSEESIEFFEEIEFYQWLSTMDETDDHLSRLDGPAPGAGPGGVGQGEEHRDQGRGAGDGNAGVSRVI